ITVPCTTFMYTLSLHDALPIFHWLHLWLGMVTGVVVLIVSITGCIYVFADELKETFYHDRFFIEASNIAPMPMSVLRDRAQEARSEEHTSELQSREKLVCRLLL